jgi:hypothetical protein
MKIRFADPHHFIADPDPFFYLNVDLDPTFHINSDPASYHSDSNTTAGLQRFRCFIILAKPCGISKNLALSFVFAYAQKTKRVTKKLLRYTVLSDSVLCEISKAPIQSLVQCPPSISD